MHQALELGLGGGDGLAVDFVAFTADGERFGAVDLLALQRVDHRAGNRSGTGVLLPAIGLEDRAIGEASGAGSKNDGELGVLDGADRNGLFRVHGVIPPES